MRPFTAPSNRRKSNPRGFFAHRGLERALIMLKQEQVAIEIIWSHLCVFRIKSSNREIPDVSHAYVHETDCIVPANVSCVGGNICRTRIF